MAEDVAPLVEALVAIIDAARMYLPGEMSKDEFVTRVLEASTIRALSRRSLLMGILLRGERLTVLIWLWRSGRGLGEPPCRANAVASR